MKKINFVLSLPDKGICLNFDFSDTKYDFRSEWMRRDINGKVDGDGIKLGEATTTIAGAVVPIVIDC